MNTNIGTFFVLLAIVAGIAATAPQAFADHGKAEVSIAMGSGLSQDCAATNICYEPHTVTIDAGGTVTWMNPDSQPHTVTAGNQEGMKTDEVGENYPGGNGWDSGLFMKDGSYSHTFDVVGEYEYFCMVHPWMAGMVIVQEAGAEKDKMMADEIMVTIKPGTAKAGEKLTIDVEFASMGGKSVEHVNYDVMATQKGKVVLDEKGVHKHDGKGSHMTAALEMAASDTNPVDVKVTFLGFGIEKPFTGPVGQVAQKQVVPEFGTIAVMILGIAIVSIIAVTAKSKVIPRI